MKYRKNYSHAGKSRAEKQAYLNSIDGVQLTVETESGFESLASETIIRDKVGTAEPLNDKVERPTKTKTNKPPYRSTKTRISNFIADYFPQIVGGVLLVMVGVVGYLYTQQYSSNRELGEIKTRLDDAQQQVNQIRQDYNSLETQQNGFDKALAVLQEDLNFVRGKL